MLSTQPLDSKTLQLLGQEVPTDQVLSAVCQVSPISPINQGGALLLRIKNQLARLEAPSAFTEAVLDDLSTAQHSTHTRAYYLWDEHGHVKTQTVDINLELPEHLSFGPPDFEPLRFALESNPLTVIVVLDHDWGRIFRLQLGNMVELQSPRGGQRIHEHNTDHSAYQANQDQTFGKSWVERLSHLLQDEGFERLLLAGSAELCAGLEAQLSPQLSKTFVGMFSVAGDASTATVLEAAQPALIAAQLESDQAALSAVREGSLRDPTATLTAAQEGRVYELLVSGDGSTLPVWRDGEGYIFAEYPAQGVSPLTGWSTEGKHLRDVLGDLRERFGLRVRFLSGELGDQLEAEMGGLAGLARYSNQG